MTKKELIEALEPYSDDAELYIRTSVPTENAQTLQEVEHFKEDNSIDLVG